MKWNELVAGDNGCEGDNSEEKHTCALFRNDIDSFYEPAQLCLQGIEVYLLSVEPLQWHLISIESP